MAQLERRRSAQERYPSLILRTPIRPSLEFWGWGRNDFGQLGLNDDQNRSTPIRLESVENKDIVHFTGSLFNSGFLTDDGEVYLSGVNDSGQLASKSQSTRLLPTRVSALETFRITHLSIGVGHTLAVTEKGSLLTWGLNDNYQLGYITDESSLIPKPVTGVRDLVFVRVAAGSGHSLALTSSGAVYSVGQATFGALGHGNDTQCTEFKYIKGLFSHGVVQIECGEFHSAALTSAGEVWTWGRGKHGQLGLGTTENIFVPKLVTTLTPQKIKQIACGDSHSLCVTKDGQVFTWGQSRWGQTGIGTTENLLVPKIVSSLSEEYIVQVSAGSRHSAALALRGAVFVFGNHKLDDESLSICSIPVQVEGLPELPVISILAKGNHNIVMFDKSPQSRVGMDNGRYGMGMQPFKVPNLFILLEENNKKHQDDSSEQFVTFLRVLEDIFGSSGFLLDTFLPRDGNGQTAKLDSYQVHEIYRKIFRSYDTKEIIQVGISCKKLLLRTLDVVSSSHEAAEDRSVHWVPLLVIIMLNPVFGETLASGSELVITLSAILKHMKSPEKTELTRLLNELPLEFFGGIIVKGVQKYLTNLAKNHDSINSPVLGQNRRDMLSVCKLLEFFYTVNEGKATGIPFEHFYNNEVSYGVDLVKEFFSWVSTDESNEESIKSICEFPFILTSDVKAKITYGEAIAKQHATMHYNQMAAMFSGIHPGLVSYLDIRIRRDHLRQDAYNQLINRSNEFHKPLKVIFVSNGVDEEGEDEGGLSKEFFQLLIEEIFNIDFGMFVYNEETRDYWFRSTDFGVEDFHMVGTVLGLAIYNKVILDVHFPLVVYKKLKSLPTNFKDLQNAFPELANNLQKLLEFEGDVENTLSMTFEVEYESFGEMCTRELKPSGTSIPVTKENREEYVELYTKYILEDSIHNQFEAFKDGFWKVTAFLSTT
eukprot:g6401.t1